MTEDSREEGAHEGRHTTATIIIRRIIYLSTTTIELITYTLCVTEIETKVRYPLYLLGIAKHGVKIKPKILDFY